MAKGRRTVTTDEKVERAGTCYNCKHGHIVRYGNDPLICECNAGEGKMVASRMACRKSEKRHGEPEIEERPKKYWFER